MKEIINYMASNSIASDSFNLCTTFFFLSLVVTWTVPWEANGTAHYVLILQTKEVKSHQIQIGIMVRSSFLRFISTDDQWNRG